MYAITLRAVAADEYEEAIKWYEERSHIAASNFIKGVDEKLDQICNNPRQYKSLYKNYHEVSVSKYPYSIIYFVDEVKKIVVITSVYHHRRSTKRKYKK